MRKTCIFCDKKNGSREHLFPATLGGRRVNKGILCHKHNNHLSPLAAILTDQLRFFNAHIGVRPDHDREKPHQATVFDKDGNAYTFSETSFRPKGGRIVSEIIDKNGYKNISMTFGTQAEVSAFLADQKSKGNELKITSRVEQTSIHQEHFHIGIGLGGAHGLRAIAYVALNFLAHHFPDVARLPELGSFKNFVLHGGNPDEYVWWLDPPAIVQPTGYDSNFEHTIEISISEKGPISGRVTLFSCLAFGVIFTEASTIKSETVVTYINPLALNAPDDFRVEKSCGDNIDLTRPISTAEALDSMIESGIAARAISVFMMRGHNFRLLNDMKGICPRLIEARKLNKHIRFAVIEDVVAEFDQRVMNQLKATEEVLSQIKADYKTALETMLASPNFPVSGGKNILPLSQDNLSRLHEFVMYEFANELEKKLESDSLNLDFLCSLFGGPDGKRIAAAEILMLAIKN